MLCRHKGDGLELLQVSLPVLFKAKVGLWKILNVVLCVAESFNTVVDIEVVVAFDEGIILSLDHFLLI